MSQKAQDNGDDNFAVLLRTLLQAVAEASILHGISAYEVMETCRWSFVKAASDPRFAVPGKQRVTKTRAAVLTGLSRREVDRLVYRRAPTSARVREIYHRGHRMLRAWHELAGYQDDDGLPLTLPLNGQAPSFEELVRSCCRDITVRAMLDELILRGTVIQLEDGRVQLVKSRYDSPSVRDEDLESGCRAIEALHDALIGKQPPAGPVHELVFDTGPVTASSGPALATQVGEAARAFFDGLRRELAAPCGDTNNNAFRAAVNVSVVVNVCED